MMIARWVCSIARIALVMSAVALTFVAPRVSEASTFTFTTIDVPSAMLTEAGGINAAGQIVGLYEDASFATHGYLLDKGSFTTIDFPGAAYSYPIGINAAGRIVGVYADARGTTHGYIAR